MRVLLTIPHYCHQDDSPLFGSLNEARATRATALRNCLTTWRTNFGPRQGWAHLDRPEVEMANVLTQVELTIVVCTTLGRHAIEELGLPSGVFLHVPSSADPLELGFECQRVLQDELGKFDFYCYSEDDLLMADAWLFAKLRWCVRGVGVECLLQPNRFELAGDGTATKLYIDGDVDRARTRAHQDISNAPEYVLKYLGEDISIRRTGNPHSGCFFLTAEQMAYWAHQPHFLDSDRSFFSPLECAATLGIMRTFRVYKPAPEVANFLEIQHCGDAWIKKIGRRNAAAAIAARRPASVAGPE